MDTATTLDKGHGRVERRTLKATTVLVQREWDKPPRSLS